MNREQRSKERYNNRIRIMQEQTFTNNFHLITIGIAVLVGSALTMAAYIALKAFEMKLATHTTLLIFIVVSTLQYFKDYLAASNKIKNTVRQWQKDEDCEIT
ncbi:hypothetical protein [Pseudoalteromonas marina]|uniref:Orphan protein n=1 Tax=Pseudoalteromonas marina TaxID=267375 RepID=A0ABT9FGC6_9GAMM|nr:hypothetical protein [Pseudoalteromonas marina]MDP2565796.1 hypothetical protein [Pseudoalteromonas marina]